LPGAEPAVDGDKNADRPIEEHEIVLDLFEPSVSVLAANAERAVQLRTEVEAAVVIRLPEFFRAFGILRFERAPVFVCDRFGDLPDDLPQRLSGHGVDVPGLQIQARRGARGALDQVTHGIEIDRPVDELAAGHARIDRFENIHGRY